MEMLAEAPTESNTESGPPPERPDRAARPRLRILIASAGRRVGLLRAFRSSAGALGVDLEIFACDAHPEWSSACIEADYAFAVPAATSPAFVDALLSACRKHDIALLVPTIDTELLVLARARERFAAIGTTVSVSSPETVAMARDKLATARFLESAGLPSPRTATVASMLADQSTWSWPLLAKPRHGSSSNGIRRIAGPAEARRLPDDEPYIVQEILHGREFTVNMFFDGEGKLRSAIPHERLKVRGGEVEKGATLRDRRLSNLARSLAATLDGPFGVLCFQAFLSDDDKVSMFEINARFGGGYPLAHSAGATFARWVLEERLGRPSTANDDWRTGVVMLRYDDAVFV